MEERNQLMRSTKKLGKVLGSMPRVNEGSSKRSEWLDLGSFE